MAPDTRPVRAEEQLAHEALGVYLDRCGFLQGRPLEIEQFPGGHSNLTYLIRAGGDEYVLRRPPLGPVPPRAHDMLREARFLSAIHPHFPPAPKPLLICDDPSILGAPFYLMERRKGIVIRQDEPSEITASPQQRRRIGEAMIDTVIRLHAIPTEPSGIAALGRPDGFLRRQVEGWSERWSRARTTDLAEMERLSLWLNKRLPASQPGTLLHNDWKLDNVMLDQDPPHRIVAVLDWEMAALGDPLVDLGILLCYWPEAGDNEDRRAFLSPVTTLPGWPSRAELVNRYARETGRDVSGMPYYEVFALFKLAVVLQQIYFRFHVGQTTDQRFATLDRRVSGLAGAAWDLARRAS